MRNAIGLMYAGAAYTLVYAIGVIVVAGAIISKHPAGPRPGPVRTTSPWAAWRR